MMKLSQLHYVSKKGFNWNELKSDDATRGAYKADVNIRGEVYPHIYFDVNPNQTTIFELKWDWRSASYYVSVRYVENEYFDDPDLRKYRGKIIIAKNVNFRNDYYDDDPLDVCYNVSFDYLGEVVSYQRVADWSMYFPCYMLFTKVNEKSESVFGSFFKTISLDEEEECDEAKIC